METGVNSEQIFSELFPRSESVRGERIFDEQSLAAMVAELHRVSERQKRLNLDQLREEFGAAKSSLINRFSFNEKQCKYLDVLSAGVAIMRHDERELAGRGLYSRRGDATKHAKEQRIGERRNIDLHAEWQQRMAIFFLRHRDDPNIANALGEFWGFLVAAERAAGLEDIAEHRIRGGQRLVTTIRCFETLGYGMRVPGARDDTRNACDVIAGKRLSTGQSLGFLISVKPSLEDTVNIEFYGSRDPAFDVHEDALSTHLYMMRRQADPRVRSGAVKLRTVLANMPAFTSEIQRFTGDPSSKFLDSFSRMWSTTVAEIEKKESAGKELAAGDNKPAPAKLHRRKTYVVGKGWI